MNPTFKKLNFAGQPEVHVLNAPETFDAALLEMTSQTTIHRSLGPEDSTTFLMAFATTQAEVDTFAEQVARQTSGDAVVWVAYPKASSKRHRCEFNRDTGWAALGAQGFEPVRQVAIDEDWSALRFRRVGFIKKLTRGSALTEEGKRRTGQPG